MSHLSGICSSADFPQDRVVIERRILLPFWQLEKLRLRVVKLWPGSHS